MGAAADCELIGNGFLGQPVNTLTTLALVVAGAALLGRPRLRWAGISLIATGSGSFLFHGPMPTGSEWAHDVSLAWLILIVAGLDEPWEGWSRLPGLLAIGILFAVAPIVADPVAVALTLVAVFFVLRRDRSATTLAPLALIGATAILGRLGSTGGPLCDPGALLQMHGVWHIGAAIGVAWWAIGTEARHSGGAADVPMPT
jgi:hypothetical protein